MHDPTLKRLTGDDIALKDLTSIDIEKIRLKGSHLIPKLEETLENQYQALDNTLPMISS